MVFTESRKGGEWFSLNLEKRLGLDDGYLVGIGMEGVNVQFVPSCLEVDVAERLEAGDGQ